MVLVLTTAGGRDTLVVGGGAARCREEAVGFVRFDETVLDLTGTAAGGGGGKEDLVVGFAEVEETTRGGIGGLETLTTCSFGMTTDASLEEVPVEVAVRGFVVGLKGFLGS